MELECPLKNTPIPANELALFLAVFSRFEFALKICGFCKPNKNKVVEVDWNKFSDSIGKEFEAHSKLFGEEITYLIEQPPKEQKLIGSMFGWNELTYLKDKPIAQKYLTYAKTVRNNLFHGGKSLPEEYGGRDLKLMKAALGVIECCINCNDKVRMEYETYGY